MNKITLSVVALSAIGAPVQMHAAELTATDKEAAIATLTQRISRVTNDINSYHEEVKEEYSNEASLIAAEIQKLAAAATVTQEEIDALDQRITVLAAAAELAQRPYAAYKELDSQCKILEKAYAEAKTETESYPNVKDAYLGYYKALGVEALRAQIDGYDLKAQDIVNDKNDLLGKMNTAIKAIEEYRSSIEEANNNVGTSKGAYDQIVEKVNGFEEAYNSKLKEVISALPSPVYKDWQDEVIEKLNEQRRIVQAISKANEEDHALNKANEKLTERLDAIANAKAEVETLIDNKLREKDTQENAKTAADNDVAGQQTVLDGMKAELEKRGLTVCDADIADVQKLIDALTAKITTEYEKHAVDKLDYAKDLTAIKTAIKNVDDNNGHKYQPVLDNHDAYTRIVKAIDDNQKLLDAAIEEAKKESNDKKYNAYDHFTKTANDIQDALTKLKTDAEKDYKGYKSVGNETKATDAANECGTKAGAFKTSAADALATYNNIEATVTAAQGDLDALKAEALDVAVTVTGNVGDKTYGTAIEETQNSIDAINTAVAAANAKADAEHLAALKAIDLTIANSSDLVTWKENYAENKKNFDKVSAVAAAESMLGALKDRVAELKTMILAVNDVTGMGNMESEIIAEMWDLHNNGLAPLSIQRMKLEEALANASTDEEKTAAALEAIAKYAEINAGLDEVEKKAEELVAKAKAAVANKKAYDETVKLVAADSDVEKALKALEDEIAGKATDTAKTFYEGELSKLKAALQTVKENIDKAYEAHTSVAGKDGFTAEIKAVETDATNLKGKIVPNENAHNDQLKTLESLNKTWQDTYTNISNNDQSSAAAGYLAQLATELEKINALDKPVADAFAKGGSAEYQPEFYEAVAAINKAIADIAQAQKEGYSAQVAKDNAESHELFLTKYGITYGTFGEAVDVLNQFSNIKNEALQTALANLLDTHKAIYDYADKLRTLKAEEQADYDKYLNDNTDAVYDVTGWIGTAEDYNAEIDALLKKYQDEVNAFAYATYNSIVTDADNAVKNNEAVVNDFKYGKKDAFKDVKDVVEAAKKAAGDAVDGIPTDRMYAVNVDTWMETLKDYEKRLEADLAAAYGKEKTGWLDAVEKLYKSEADKIGKFGNIDNAAYLAQLEEKYNATYGEAKKLDENVDPATDEGKSTVMQIVNLCKQYYSDNKYKNSQVYKDAENASKAGVASLEAYNRIIALLDAADTRAADAAAWVNAMYVAHDSKYPTVSNKLQSIIDELAGYRKTAAEKNDVNACVDYEKAITEIVKAGGKDDNSIDKQIEALKLQAIYSSFNNCLQERINAVQEQYNQVAKEDLDAVKPFEEVIAGYNTELEEITDRWLNGDLKDKLDETRAVILDFESRVVVTYDELLKMQTGESLDVTAIIAEALGRADDKLAEVKGWADYNEATGELGDDVVAYLTGKLDAIKAYKAEKEGSLHFYKDNILSDIEKFIEEADRKCAELKAEYEKQKANDDAYTAINGKLDTLVSDLETAYGKVKDFTYIYAPDEWKAGLEEDIAGLRADVDAAHAGVLLSKADAYDNEISDIASDIATGEKDFKNTEINGIITYEISSSLRSALTVINSKQYSNATRIKLLSEYNRINDLVKYATTFNRSSYNSGIVYYDIDGNYLEKPQAIDYSTEAWETVSARLAQLASDVAQLAEDADNLSYVTGDADGDGRVTVNDYSEVRNMILTAAVYEEIPEAKRYGADANNDKQINVADMTTISNIIFYNNPLGKDAVETASASKARVRTVAASASADDELTLTKVSEETGVFGKTVRIAVNVSHVEAFTAGQFDITLPAGMKLAGQSLSERADGHELFYNEIGDNTFRTVVATIDNNEFSGRDGAIVYLDVEVDSSFDGNAKIGVDNIFFSDAAGKSYALGTAGSGATGIDGIEAATVKERIYSVGGQLLKAVNKGLNIIVGENGNTKKILKK